MKLLGSIDRHGLFLLFILATVPLLFGARHPFIQGCYAFLLLLSAGIWLVFHFEEMKHQLLRPRLLPPLILVLYIFFTSFSLPLSLLSFLSPVRAGYLEQASQIALLRDPVTSISYFAAGTRLYGVYLTALLLYFFYSSRLLRSRELLFAALWVVTGVGTVEAVYGLTQALIPSLGVLWLPSEVSAAGSARGTIIYRNQFAAFMNMCWPLAVTLGVVLYKPVIDKIRFRRKMNNPLTLSEKVATVFQKATLPFWAALFMVLAVIFSRSRGGIIVMALVAALLIVFFPFSRRIKLLAAGGFSLLIITYGGLIGFQTIIHRFLAFYEGALGRITLWMDSLSMLFDHPWTGIGMGAYKYLSPVYLDDVPGNTWFDFAHNEYVELALELGVPMFLLLLAWIAWGTAMALARAWKMKKEAKGVSVIEIRDGGIIAIGAACALIGFISHPLVDFTWRLPANLIYGVTLLALLSSGITNETERT
ncbi:MAG: hypothetical protein Kow0089_17130 [Desulfobulbaceae bacterium]